MTTQQKPSLVGVAGFARSGKDTIGAYLAEHHGYQRRAFADKLRELALVCDPILGEDRYGRERRYADALTESGYEGAKTEWSEVRNFLVRLGAGARQVLGQDVWLDATLPPDGDPFFPTWESYGLKPAVITDVRYPNEAKRIQALGGTLVYVSRAAASAANGEEAQSISRVLAECAPITHLYNNGTLEDLYRQVEVRLCGAPL